MDWVCFQIHGTTFSGHPTATTMMNTWRSIMYMFFYLRKAGVPRPWLVKELLVIAAGDDSNLTAIGEICIAYGVQL